MSKPVTTRLPRVFGVIGHPVAHSKSPAMHRAAMRVLDLPHDYFAFAVRPEMLREALRGALALGLGGLNVTVPHKRSVLEHMDAVTETAKRTESVNTVMVERARLVGDNTDGLGFAQALRELGGEPIKRAVILGTGGAARSIIDALTRPPRPRGGVDWDPLRDPARVTWVSRSPELAPDLPGVRKIAWDEVNEKLAGADLLVNATTVGMQRGPVSFPVPPDPSKLGQTARVIDIVYPRPTWGLLDAAAQAGLAVQDGLPMLLWQGVEALERWIGQTLPEEAIAAMRAALEA